MPSFADTYGLDAGMVTAVDLVRGLGVLTGIEVVEVDGATGWYDTDYEGKRDAALDGLRDGADLFVIHVEATDEAGHAGNVEEKVRALENWDRRILADLVPALDAIGPVAPAAAARPRHAAARSRPTPRTRCPTCWSTRPSTVPVATYTEVGVAERDVGPRPRADGAAARSLSRIARRRRRAALTRALGPPRSGPPRWPLAHAVLARVVHAVG